MKLGEYLSSLSSVKRKAGVHDCCTFTANWAILNGLPDLMAEFRGAYSDEENGLKIISNMGGLLSAFSEKLESIGVKRTSNPRIGDIGVINVGGFEAGSIYTGKRWAFVGGKGVCAAHVNSDYIYGIWALNCNG